MNEQRLNDFVGKALGDLGSALTASLVVVGERLGLYRAMADGEPVTAVELAKRTGTNERCVREWLAAQAASGYLEHHPTTGRYSLPVEHAVALTDDNSPACVLGGFIGMTAAMRATPRVIDAFRNGKGVGWHEHDPELFEGTERFFRPGYNAYLVSQWIPALDGVAARLERGARVADVGCGHGASTVIMAKAFPRSTFVGFDYHAASIERARQRAAEAGVADRVTFEVAPAHSFPGTYDLVGMFDCLHDMGDPEGAARHIRSALAPGGTWLLVEPYADDDLANNLNPVGRSSTRCRRWSARRRRWRRISAQPSERRRARVGCPRSSVVPASPTSAARARHRSIWSSRSAPERLPGRQLDEVQDGLTGAVAGHSADARRAAVPSASVSQPFALRTHTGRLAPPASSFRAPTPSGARSSPVRRIR